MTREKKSKSLHCLFFLTTMVDKDDDVDENDNDDNDDDDNDNDDDDDHDQAEGPTGRHRAPAGDGYGLKNSWIRWP